VSAADPLGVEGGIKCLSCKGIFRNARELARHRREDDCENGAEVWL
jgi:hypothetical protein